MAHTCNPPTWEAEAGELLEPGKWRLQWAEITPFYTLAWANESKIPSQFFQILVSCLPLITGLREVEHSTPFLYRWQYMSREYMVCNSFLHLTHNYCNINICQAWQESAFPFSPKECDYGLGTVAHLCNPSTLGGWSRRILWGQEFKTSLGNRVRPCFYKKF